MMKTPKERMKISQRARLFAQLIFAALVNGYLVGFVKGKIFTGKSKMICLPVLNCYSCPAALGACPIGALQAVEGGAGRTIAFYVLGSIMLFGVVLGRLICGFLCPFGLIQDLLHKIPLRKIKVPTGVDRVLRKVKYLMLIFLVLLLPMFLNNKFGMASPYFCKWICPAGILEGAFPLLLKDESIRNGIGLLFNWKLLILIATVVFSVLIYRPFCKYICPLGAFYGLFNRLSFYRMEVGGLKCTGCKACEKICPMQVKVTENINSAECIRCGRCKAICPESAITSGFKFK